MKLKLLPFILLAIGARAGQVQVPNLQVPASSAANKQDVVDIFTKSYQAYRKFAFGHDQLNPLSQIVEDTLNGWGATIIDSLDTMAIMGLDNFLEEGLNFTSKVDFTNSNTPDPVNFFETTIRYVGGLLSAYEVTGQKHQFLVDQARTLADRLSLVWSKGNTIPFTRVFFQNNTVEDEITGLATASSDTLEFFTLSKYTGNDTYRQLAEGGVRTVLAAPHPLPGLPGMLFNATTNVPQSGYVTWGGGSDSFFEYLIKYARLTNTDDQIFADSWLLAADTSIKVLARRSIVGNHLYLADFDSQRRIRHVGSNLECFHAGNWIFAGKLANNDTIVNFGLELNEACWNTYASTATGIGPDQFSFISSDGSFTGGDAPTQDQLAFNQQHGFYITSPAYIERPEVLESNFYAWRATGDTKYLDRAAGIIPSFNKFLQTDTGYAAINDVTSTDDTRADDMETFWFAEVLKYLYLTFDDPSHISLDEWVFNTEAHPFRAPPAKPVYGTQQ